MPAIPETVLAAIAVISGPSFFFQMIGERRFGPAMFMLLGGVASLWLFTVGLSKKSNLLAYVAVLGILAVAMHTITLART